MIDHQTDHQSTTPSVMRVLRGQKTTKYHSIPTVVEMALSIVINCSITL